MGEGGQFAPRWPAAVIFFQNVARRPMMVARRAQNLEEQKARARPGGDQRTIHSAAAHTRRLGFGVKSWE